MPSYRSRVLGVALVAALSASPARSQLAPAAPPDTLSLDALLAAVEATPAIRAARLGVEAAGARARAIGFRPDPEVEAMVRPGVLASGEGDLVMARVVQPLPYPSVLRREREAAMAMAEAEGFRADAEAADLRLAIRQAYYGLYRAQALDALVRQFQQRLGAFAEAAAVRYEVGRGTQGAILQAQLEGGRFEAELLALATERHGALAELAGLVGRPDLALHAATHGTPSVVVEIPPLPTDADSALVDIALAGRAEFAALAAEGRGADAEVALARLAFRPELGVMAGVTVMGFMPGELVAAPGVGVTLRLPLNRARLRARFEEAGLRRAQVDARREALTADVASDLVRSAAAARRAAATLDLYRRRLLPQAETAVEAVLVAYTTGQGGFLDLLETERTRFDLLTAAEEARYRYLVALAELERALGTSTSAPPAPSVDPEPPLGPEPVPATRTIRADVGAQTP